jgi:6-phosphogluconolactonase
MGLRPEITIADDPVDLAETAARLITDAAAATIARQGRFMVALAGGGTPRQTYARLAQPPYREEISWDRVWIFFGDERCVAPDHAESNYRVAEEALLAHVPVPPSRIFRMRGEADDPDAAAAEYGRTMAQAFGLRRGELPRFDLILLGLGVDGHTGSLFPGSPALKEVFRPVAGVHAAAAAIPQRLTLTFPVLNAATLVLFLVSGSEKAKIVKAALLDEIPLPATMVAPSDGRLIWLLDRPAAALLSPPGGR